MATAATLPTGRRLAGWSTYEIGPKEHQVSERAAAWVVAQKAGSIVECDGLPAGPLEDDLFDAWDKLKDFRGAATAE